MLNITQPPQPQQPPQPAQPPQQTQPSQPQQPQKQGLDLNFDSTTKLTIQWVAIFYLASRFIEFISNWIGFRFFGGGMLGKYAGYVSFPVNDFIKDMIWAAIIGIVLGFVVSKYWVYFQNWNQKTFKFATPFKFFLVWDIIVAIVVGVLLSFTVFFFGTLPLIFNVAGIVVGAYVFAQGFTKKLGHLYKF